MESIPPLTESEIVDIVEEYLPQWKSACSNPDAESILLTQGAFSTSEQDMFLLAVAIKYAGIAKKNLRIALD